MRSLSWALTYISASYAGFLCSWTCVCSEVFLCFAAGLQKTKRAMNISVEKMQSHMGCSEHVDSRKPWKWKPDKWFEGNKYGRKIFFWFTRHGYYWQALAYFLFRDWRTSQLIMHASRSLCMIHTLAAWHFTDHSTSPTLSALSHPRHAANVSGKTWQQRAFSKIAMLLFKD